MQSQLVHFVFCVGGYLLFRSLIMLLELMLGALATNCEACLGGQTRGILAKTSKI